MEVFRMIIVVFEARMMEVFRMIILVFSSIILNIRMILQIVLRPSRAVHCISPSQYIELYTAYSITTLQISKRNKKASPGLLKAFSRY